MPGALTFSRWGGEVLIGGEIFHRKKLKNTSFRRFFCNKLIKVHSKITMAGDVVSYYTVTAQVPTLSDSAASLM